MTAAEQLRTCTRCGQDKPFDAFGRHPSGKDGLQSWCNACRADNNRRKRQSTGSTQNLATKAQQRGRQRLCQLHPDELRDLIDEERLKLGLPKVRRKKP